MQAITTKYIPPSNTRGSRIKASCEAGSVTLPWSYEGSDEQTHRGAAEALAAKLGWTGPVYGRLVTGFLPDGRGVHVFEGETLYRCREAVILTRKAIRDGHNNGNPHSRPYGRAVASLTDGGPLGQDYAAFVEGVAE